MRWRTVDPLCRNAQAASCCCAAAIAVVAVSPAFGQAATPPQADPDAADVVVVGERGSVITGTAPLTTLDTGAIAATGATTMAELLRAIRSTTQAADGSDPIFLLNAQRVSGYQDIGTLPPEAIEKVEVLPEQAALKFGYPPTRRLVNFITKRHFRQVEVRANAGTTTRGGATRENGFVGLTRLHNDSRLTLTFEVRHTDPVRQASRDVVPDPDILFDSIGNVVAVDGGEIDPALSAAVGHIVTVVPVPGSAAHDTTLADFASGAGQPRLFDLSPYRTLAPGNDAVKGEAVIAGRIGKTIASTLSLSAEQSRDRVRNGPSAATLLVPAGNPYSPFAGPVLLERYLTEADPARTRQTTTTLHAGLLLRGVLWGWKWDVTAAFDQQQIDGRNDRGVDPTAANAAIAAGADPFAPLAPALLTQRLVDVAQSRTRTAGLKAVISNTPVDLPAGAMTLTATAEAERASANSFTRGPNPFALNLARDRVEGALAIDVPLTSPRAEVLPVIGDLSLNASANARQIGGFGALYDATYGLTWAPFAGVQLLAASRQSAAPPPLLQQVTPELRYINVPVFDYGTGRSEITTLVQKGNPDLAAEHRHVTALTLNIKPFKTRELRLAATYEATTIRNQTGTVYALSPRNEDLVPGLATRDAAGRLVSVTFRPTNFYRERQRALNIVLSASGMLGTPKPPAAGQQPASRPSFYGGIGPTIKFSDRLEVRADTPALDLLRGDTVLGWGVPRVSGYFYGGINQLGNGMTFDAWYNGANRVRGAVPAADLSNAPLFKLNISGSLSVHQFLKHAAWTKHLGVKIDVNNVTDAHQRVRDGNGAVPNRFQPDYLDPVGRVVSLTLRKLL